MTRLVALAAVLVGCSGSDDKVGTTTEPETCGETDLTFGDGNNYTFASDFQIGSKLVTPETDFDIEWGSLSTDIRGRSVDPTAIEQMILVEFGLTKDGVLDKINRNDLQQTDALNQYLWFNTDSEDTTVVSEFAIIGQPINIALLDDDPDTTWLLSLANIVGGRFDFVMNTFVVPTTGESNTNIVFGDDSALLNFDVDLHTAEPLCAVPDDPAITVDWSSVTTDAYERPLDLSLVNNLVLGHVIDENITDVEELFLRLYDEADQVYDLDVNALTSADLSGALSRADGTTPFPGFTADGTWVLAIECVRQECTNPAPLLLAVVTVE